MHTQWYSVELPREKSEEFKEYLRKREISYEPSEAHNLIHFECKMTENDLRHANKWLKEHA